jgi:tetratricopeptide (TPR) repeat protein
MEITKTRSRSGSGPTFRLVAAVLAGAATLLAQDGAKPRGKSGAADAPAQQIVEQMRQAEELASRAKGLKGDARNEALARAAQAFRAIVDAHPEDQQKCARAWFRIGDLERGKSDLAAAEVAYAHAAELDGDRYGERALLECAHMQRRLARVDEAIATYRKVAAMNPDSERAHDARVWIGTCLESKGDLDGAIDTFSEALRTTTEPARVIELCNKLANALVDRGDLNGAATAIARAEEAVPSGDEDDIPRLRKSVESMSARKALQKARDKAAHAHEDAQQLEAARASKKQ